MSGGEPEDIEKALELLQGALAEAPEGRRNRIIQKFLLAAVGSIPWVGGFLSAAATIKSDEQQVRTNVLQSKWLEEHENKINELQAALARIVARFENFGEKVHERIESQEYLGLVRKTFRVWDRSDTDEKRGYLCDLLANAAGTRLCSDDVVRLFIEWLDSYHESHLALIRYVYAHPGATRAEIWSELWGDLVREDSAEADLFKLLIRDLSTGSVIRQERQRDAFGNFLKKSRPTTRGGGTKTTESAFEDSKGYELTELGNQFVHYAMTQATRRLEDSEGEPK